VALTEEVAAWETDAPKLFVWLHVVLCVEERVCVWVRSARDADAVIVEVSLDVIEVVPDGVALGDEEGVDEVDEVAVGECDVV
jgi:hypothetical protein